MPVQLDLKLIAEPVGRTDAPILLVGLQTVSLRLVRNLRARRYVLRLGADGSARVTIPRGGSIAEAKGFAQRNVPWLQKQLVRQANRPVLPSTWLLGTEIFFRGERVRLEADPEQAPGMARFGGEVVPVAYLGGDLRRVIERHLRALATKELPRRVAELASQHQLTVRRVSVRDQRSRWGSCSRRGTISLNWRLIQTPPFVSDYIVLHELAHLKEMNHSRRFWKVVAQLCPDFALAERWLKQHADLLREQGSW